MAAVITSTANTRIKRIRALRMRKERDEQQLAFVEGIRSVVEAIQVEAPLDCLVICQQLLKGQVAWDAVNIARAAGTEVIEVDETVFRTLSRREGPQGIAAVVQQQL